MLTLEEKKAIIADVARYAEKAQSAIAAEYSGLTVADMTALRAKAREAGVYVRVVKNTLARRALAETDFACMADSLKGPLVLALSGDEPAAAARIVTEFAKGNDKLVVRACALRNRLLAPQDAETLARMPTKEQAIGQLMAVMKAPVEKLARTLNEVPARLVRTIAAVRDQKQAA